MTVAGIHRVVEHQAASRPDAAALVDGDRSLTYRELNRRANVVARKLMDRGFRRGGHAVVNAEPSPELAVVLLAVLKAGGAYTWCEGDPTFPRGVSILKSETATEQRWESVDVMRAAGESGPMCPNLPIITRTGDVACVLRGGEGTPAVLVPHEAITALMDRPVSPVVSWAGEPGALDLWLSLMAGATAVVTTAAPAVAA